MKTRERSIWIVAPVLAISIGFLVPNAAAQADPYPKMTPVDQYLMGKEPRDSVGEECLPPASLAALQNR